MVDVYDWTGAKININDTVLWSLRDQMIYGEVTEIDEQEYNYYDKGNRKEKLRRVKVITLPGLGDVPGKEHLIIEKLHSNAFPTITRFSKSRGG